MAFDWKRRVLSVRKAAALCAILMLAGPGLVRADDPAPVPGSKTKRLFWKVVSPTTEVYFLGSVHFAGEDFYPLPPEIEAAFAKSDALAVEADISNVKQEDMMALAAQSMYPAGDTLSKHVSPETMKALTTFCETNGVPIAVMMMFKPVIVGAQVEEAALQKLGMRPELGIDMHFLKQAGDTKKKVIELESIAAQLKLLMGMDDKAADKFLAETLKENTGTEMEKLMKAWKAGDEKTMEELVAADKNDAEAQKVMTAILDDRNVTMVQKIEEMLKGKEKVFLVVGAGHLVGDKGVLKMLEKDKFKVERPELTVPAKPAAAPNP